MVHRILKSLCVYLALFAATSIGWAQCPPGAGQIVKQFLDYDLNGYRLSSENHGAIWELTQQNGEPPDAPVTITKSYELVGESPVRGGCVIRVQAAIFGFVEERDTGLAFRNASKTTESWNVPVVCTKSSCSINIGFAEFKIPPHPNRDAAAVWLSTLERIQNTPQGATRMHQLVELVRSLR